VGGAWLGQPALHVIEHHLAAIILDEVADEFIVQIDIEVLAMRYSCSREPAASGSA